MDKKIRLLCADGDREAMASVVEQLGIKGLRVTELAEGANKKELVLAVLSEKFYADKSLMEKLLGLIGSGTENILPLQLDSAEIPDVIKNPLYSRNIISVPGRDASLIAERIIAALPQKKSRLPVILSAAAVLILAIVGLLIWRGTQKPEEPAAPEETEPVRLSYALPEGITEEDLADIRCVVIIGEHLKVYNSKERLGRESRYDTHWVDMLYELGVDDFINEDNIEWYWKEDGTQASMTAYDLRFLSLMPNLEELHMALADVTEAPDLSELKRLNVIWAYECRLGDVSWIADSNAGEMQMRSHVDLTPLGQSKHLNRLTAVDFSDSGTDFSAFSPANLTSLDITFRGAVQTDLSGLLNCKNLQTLRMADAAIEDLSFLENAKKLEYLQVNYMRRLRDISALNNLTSLRTLEITDCNAIMDLSPISTCAGLKKLRYATWGYETAFDGGILEPLTKLESLELQNVSMQNLDFLYTIAESRSKIDFSITGIIGDYSALQAFDVYGELNINPDDNTPTDQILPYLADATINNLHLRRFANPDLSLLPKVVGGLELDSCGIKDLSTLPEGYLAPDIYLNKCSKLESLEGVQKLLRFGKNGSGLLDVYACPRLTDWSALEGMDLYSLAVTGGFTLPDFSTVRMSNLRIDSVGDITDLEFLSSMDNSKSCNFELAGLNEVTNLKPLFQFKGERLGVPPQLAEQAEDLVNSGNFWDYYIVYPQGGWEINHPEIKLESLEELETLPPALLRHVSSVTLVGDRIIDTNDYDIFEDYSRRDRQGNPALRIRNRETGEESTIELGTMQDLSIFSELTGLRELRLYAQPLTDLNGVQVFSELEIFEAKLCPILTDASGLFTLQNLREIILNDTPVDSIQGVQNLTELYRIEISRTKVRDLTPLAQADFSRAYAEGGFELDANELELSEEDFRAIGTIRRFSSLDFTDADPAVWIPALANSEISYFGGAGDFRSNEDLAAFAADHPELYGLYLGQAEGITDLTPLLSVENLNYVTISYQMKEAIASIEGQDYGFRLSY